MRTGCNLNVDSAHPGSHLVCSPTNLKDVACMGMKLNELCVCHTESGLGWLSIEVSYLVQIAYVHRMVSC